jgi:hypothetical protein
MTPLTHALERPEFGSVELGIDPEETDRRIEETIKGLSTSQTPEGVNYRTRDGMLVVIVGPADGDEAKARLAYRTEPASEPATRKASKILAALEPQVLDG